MGGDWEDVSLIDLRSRRKENGAYPRGTQGDLSLSLTESHLHLNAEVANALADQLNIGRGREDTQTLG